MIYQRLITHSVASLMLLVSTASLAQQAEGPLPPLVEVDSANAQMITARIWVPGTVLSVTDSELAAEVSGRINWLANVGDRVKAGEVLAKLDDKRLNIRLTQDRADIAKWEARVSLLSSRLKRFTSMAKQQNTSEDALDQVKSELVIAKQELAQAESNLAMTQYELSQSQVTAPFDALVVERIKSPGEYTSTGEVLLRVVNPTQVEASVRAPLSVIPFIQAGMSVPIKNSSKQATQTVRTIVPVGNARSRMMELRITLDPDAFAIGSAVRVGLPNSVAHKGITVPRDALVLRKTGTFIYQLDSENQAQQIAVVTGVGLGERIEVSGEVMPNSPVVVRGAERLRPGDKVRVKQGNDASSLIAGRR